MEQNGSCQLDLTKLVFAGLQQLYNNPLFSDVTIICPDDTQLHCHQCVLASASKQFADLFKSGQLSGKTLPVQGVGAEALKAIIKALYTGNCQVTLQTAGQLYDAAQKLEVPQLPLAIEHFILTSLTPDNCCEALEHSMSAGATSLASLCMHVLKARLPEVLLATGFLIRSVPIVRFICSELAQSGQAPALQAAAAWLRCSDVRIVHAGQLAEDIGTNVESLLGAIPALPPVPTGDKRHTGLLNGTGVAGLESDGQSISLGALESVPMLQLLQQGSLGSAGVGLLGPGVLATSRNVGQGGMLSPSSLGPLVGQNRAGHPSELSYDSLSLSLQQGLEGLPVHSQAMQMLGGNGMHGMQGGGMDGGGIPAGLTGKGGKMPGGGQGPERSGMGGSRDMGKPGRNGVGGRGSGSGGGGRHLTIPPMQDGDGTHMLMGGGMGSPMSPSGGPSGNNGPPVITAVQSQINIVGLPGGSAGPVCGPILPSRRPPSAQGVCHVEGCDADLTGLRNYYQRYKICEYHLKVSSIFKDGMMQRFCQQCGRFHSIHEFEGNKRSCRAVLKRHSERRSKKQRLDAAKAGFSTGGDMPYDQQLGGEAFSSAPFDREGMGSASGDGAGMHAVSHLQLLQAVQASGGVGVSMDGANGTGDMHGGKGEHMDPDDDATHGSDLGTSEGEADLNAADSGGADGAASGVDGDDKDAAD